MAKNKKKNKKQSFLKTIKSSIPSNQILYSILGGVGAGLALGTAVDKDKRQALVNKVTSTFHGLSRPSNTSITPEARIAS